MKVVPCPLSIPGCKVVPTKGGRRPLPAVVFLAACSIALCVGGALAQTNRVEHNGRDLFLSGLNLAWQDFANDVGPSLATPDTGHFTDVLSQIESNGGNIMRLWLHTNGSVTPAWQGALVTGPGTDTIDDLKTVLDLAWENNVGLMLCLWSFDMLDTQYGAGVNDRAEILLTDPYYRGQYVTNALIPMVEALEGHPAIIAWEIFNEPEGMSNELGWGNTIHVPMADIQAFVNLCAGAIHRADPSAKVTNGSASFHALTDVGAGNFNYYTDARLIAAGGDPDGALDFYCVHSYPWAGTSRSPFQFPASHWALTKPLVVAEFFVNCGGCTSTPYDLLYQTGYAGALAWSWTDWDHGQMLSQINDVFTNHPGDVLIRLPGSPDVSLTAPANGQSYASGVTVSITAIATDSNGSVTNVAFYAGSTKLGEDDTAPYAYDWVNAPGGSHIVKAVATDDEGLSTTSPSACIWVGNDPTVAITAPANGASFTNAATVSIQATASDTDGTILKVEFYQGATKLGEDTSEPYQYDWVGPPEGNYPLTARATDDSGLSSESVIVHITVGSPPPPVRLEAEDATVAGSASVGLDPTASGGGMVAMRDGPGSSIAWTVYNVPSAGIWDMVIGYDIPFGSKSQHVYVNGVFLGTATFAGAIGEWQEVTWQLPFDAGLNEFMIVGNAGWMSFDYIEFDFVSTNTAPVLTMPSDMTVNAGTQLSVPITAADPEVPPQLLIFSLADGPSGSSVRDLQGTFSWRPLVSQADSTNPVTVVVSDNGSPFLSDTGTFTIVVQPLADPVIGSIDASGGQVSLQVTGDEGPDYSLLTTTDMENWGVLYTTNSPLLPVLLVDSNLTAAPFRAYRIGLGP